ncbi:MAG TPA: GNAT family N-acetyltransferase [Polyangiales bacterium]
MSGQPLDRLFSPRAVAVVGVSDRADSVGGQVFDNLRRGGFRGALYAVNPNHERVRGAQAYASVEAIAQPIDLVVVAVPAAKVPEVLEQCGKHCVAFAVVLSAGFAEIGPSGVALLHEALDKARAHGVRVLGPNCLGLMRRPSALNASFGRAGTYPGKLALVSQSGAICSAVVDWAQARGIGLSTVVSMGAAADIGFGDVLDYLALDPETEAIFLYVEGIDQARLFMSGLRAAARMKPVIVVKAGRHAAAARAAASHTGAVVGDDAVFESALRRAGAVRVTGLETLFSAAELLARAHEVRGNRLAIVTNAGGVGVLAVDRALDLGLQLAPIEGATLQQLQALLPPQAATINPIDLLGDAAPERYAAAMQLCLADARVDAVLVLLTPQTMTRPEEIANMVVAAASRTRKPVLACLMGGPQVEAARAELVAHAVPSFESPEAAVEAFALLVAYRDNQELLLHVPEPFADASLADVGAARAVIDEALGSGRALLSQLEAKAVLQAFGIPTVASVAAHSADAAVAAADALGYPVAMKIDSPDITHKSDVGGVRLSLRNAEQVRAAYVQLLSEVQRNAPNAVLRGVVVERMLVQPDARELLIGTVRDAAFGPAIAFGPGGTLVELFGGPEIALPPLNTELAHHMLQRSRVARWLGAYRNLPAVNQDALVHILMRVSELVCELPEVQELDLNPVLAGPQGAVVLDARIVVAPDGAIGHPYRHLAIAPFPRQLSREVRLRTGEPLTLRPIRPEDARMEQHFVRSLSSQAKYFRFMRALVELTPQMLVRFTQIDYDREMAFIAIAHEQREEREVGVARYVSDPDGKGCEFAIVVADAWRGKGLGQQLMAALIDAAKQRGLSTMHGEVMAENTAMLGLMRRLGFQITPHPEDRMLTLTTLTLH